MGFSRAVRVGPHVFVAGTAPVMPKGEELPPDAYSQTKRCLSLLHLRLGLLHLCL